MMSAVVLSKPPGTGAGSVSVLFFNKIIFIFNSGLDSNQTDLLVILHRGLAD